MNSKCIRTDKEKWINAEKLKKAQNECFCCGSGDLTLQGHPEYSFGNVVAHVECESCGAEYMEVYALSSIHHMNKRVDGNSVDSYDIIKGE